LLTDITEKRQTHEALMLAKEEAERACAVKTNFLATMSHEIRTPMNGLLGIIDLMRDTELTQEQRRYLNIAMTSGRALHEIINDILDYAKMEAGKTTLIAAPFSLRELMSDVLDLTSPIAEDKHLEFTFNVPEAVSDRYVNDAGRLRQILLNLLTNAVKFTDRGQVTLRVTSLLTQANGDHDIDLVRFEVADTGIGISAVDQDKLFREFSQVETVSTRRFGGTGLGLAITRRLVTMMNGEIGVESKPGQGSKFWFILPLAIDQKDQPSEQKGISIPGSQDIVVKSEQRLLLVEDNDTNRLVASRYLDKAGYPHDDVTTGGEAIAKAKTIPYNLILMDISMPDMDGFEAAREIRAIGDWAKKVPILALTAHVMPGDRERCLAAGMNDHIAKPLNYDELVSKLAWWLESAAVPPTSPARKDVPFDASPDIDGAVLKRLADDLGTEAALRITETFLGDLPKRVESLWSSDIAHDLNGISRAAHTLKSSSGNCGLVKFSTYMAGLEAAASTNDSMVVKDLMQKLGPLHEAARRALIEERARYQG
jgi:CheY-like chemotaxis protein/nitrogen-specific signal transduction histidine kinase/HPt (histidine-containing phosphotransfer) domain-containing protein